MARIGIIRLKSFVGMGVGIELEIDGQVLKKIKNGKREYFELPEGTHRLVLRTPNKKTVEEFINFTEENNYCELSIAIQIEGTANNGHPIINSLEYGHIGTDNIVKYNNPNAAVKPVEAVKSQYKFFTYSALIGGVTGIVLSLLYGFFGVNSLFRYAMIPAGYAIVFGLIGIKYSKRGIIAFLLGILTFVIQYFFIAN